jgi:hypothetical protein
MGRQGVEVRVGEISPFAKPRVLGMARNNLRRRAPAREDKRLRVKPGVKPG